jgi:hypothetical protein
MLVTKEMIRDRHGKIIGWVETDNLGNKVVRDFSGHIKGRYKKVHNATFDFYGKIVAYGDATAGLLYKR